ncbi:ketoacyl-ACP synthase III family protein [Saccharopolyspora erythraea]|uniref:ketoacyl-ACP synthase III family protein n=1 Tax=Saccharopolyspora erythraea TaxID=1836 RepID=UPI001BAD7A52|nr:ketoacyl-ACP synthase III family protein [Saccharopolyspora erythraea]QUH01511.1 ketoacyl-ACP synthase III family protein [Saccharopolyspora erythraea]
MRIAPAALTLDAVTTWLPPGRETAAEVVRAGRLPAGEVPDLGLSHVPVSELAAPEMAVRAARTALADAGADPARIGFLAHAWIYHQGHDFWSPAHYIANEIGAGRAFPVGVQQLSNAGAAAVGLAVDRMLADPGVDSALVTTADRFAPPGFDRWSADYGVVYGDAGTAAVLRRRGSGLHLRSLAFTTAAEFEVMYRGRDEFSPAPMWRGAVDIRRPKKAYLEQHGGNAEFQSTARESVRGVLLRALSDAGVEPDDSRIACVALPRLSDSVLDMMYLPVLEGLVKGEVLRLREESGHLGAGDLLANLTHISRSGLLGSGEFAVLIGGGGGFTWSCLVVQAP